MYKAVALVVLFIFVTIFLLFKHSFSFAQEISDEIRVEYEQSNPDGGFNYALKRLKEKTIILILSPFTAKKADYLESLVDVRLAELKYVIDKKDMDNFQLATQRYSATAGQYAEFLIKNNLVDRKERTRVLFKSHLPVIENLKSVFTDTTAEWRFVKQDEDYLKIYISQLE